MKNRLTDWNKHKKRIVDLYERGYSLRDIAKMYHVSHATINKWLSRWGILRRNGKARQRANVKDIVNTRKGSLTILALDTSKYPTHWICRCDCGRMINIRADVLKRRKHPTCGNKSCKAKVKA